MHDGFGVKAGEHVPGKVMHRYYEACAKEWQLLDRIILKSRVSTVEKRADGWRLTVQGPAHASEEAQQESEYHIVTKKLIVATGVTNAPHEPCILGSSTLRGSDCAFRFAWL